MIFTTIANTEILQARAKFNRLTIKIPKGSQFQSPWEGLVCKYFTWNAVMTLWVRWLGNNISCRNFAVQTLLWSLEFVFLKKSWTQLYQTCYYYYYYNHRYFLAYCSKTHLVGKKGKKAPPTSFFPVTSTNVGFGPQNFLTFSFNPFVTLVKNLKFVSSARPKLLNLNQDHP